MKKFLILIAGLAILFACNDETEDPPQAFLNASLQYTDRETNQEIDSVAVSVIGLGMENHWISEKNLLRTSTDTLRSILLPLNDTDSTDYIITLNGLADTVRFFTEHDFFYESMETGFYLKFKIKNIETTNHRIDNVEVLDSVVTKEWNENIIININTVAVTNN